MLKLQKCKFTVSYKKGKELFVADTLSREATNVHDDTSRTVMQECEVFRVELAQMDLGADRVTVETMNRIRKETSKHLLLAVLHKGGSEWMAFRKEGSARANQSLLRFKRRDHSV